MTPKRPNVAALVGIFSFVVGLALLLTYEYIASGAVFVVSGIAGIYPYAVRWALALRFRLRLRGYDLSRGLGTWNSKKEPHLHWGAPSLPRPRKPGG